MFCTMTATYVFVLIITFVYIQMVYVLVASGVKLPRGCYRAGQYLNIRLGVVGKACRKPYSSFPKAVEIMNTRLHVN